MIEQKNIMIHNKVDPRDAKLGGKALIQAHFVVVCLLICKALEEIPYS